MLPCIFLQYFADKPIQLTFVASLLGGSCVALTMQPFDVVATRLYNQGTKLVNLKMKYFS